MPFKSQAQRSWMYANHPRMAKRWQSETPAKPLPQHVPKKKTTPYSRMKNRSED